MIDVIRLCREHDAWIAREFVLDRNFVVGARIIRGDEWVAKHMTDMRMARLIAWVKPRRGMDRMTGGTAETILAAEVNARLIYESDWDGDIKDQYLIAVRAFARDALDLLRWRPRYLEQRLSRLMSENPGWWRRQAIGRVCYDAIRAHNHFVRGHRHIHPRWKRCIGGLAVRWYEFIPTKLCAPSRGAA